MEKNVINHTFRFLLIMMAPFYHELMIAGILGGFVIDIGYKFIFQIALIVFSTLSRRLCRFD